MGLAMTDDQAAFLQHIRGDPDDDTARLVYADWLEEQGEADRGEFIRIQCQLARIVPGESHPDLPRWKRREAELLAVNEKRWTADLRGLANSWEFHRGFIEQVVIEAARFLESAAVLFDRIPTIRAVRLIDAGRLVDRLAAAAPLALPIRLHLNSNYLDDAAVARLLESPYLSDTRGLDLSRNHITCGGAEALAASPRLPRLAELNLAANFITSRGAMALARSKHRSALEHLDLNCNYIGWEGQEVLHERFGARARYFAQADPSQKQRLMAWVAHQLETQGRLAPSTRAFLEGLRDSPDNL